MIPLLTTKYKPIIIQKYVEWMILFHIKDKQSTIKAGLDFVLSEESKRNVEHTIFN